MYTINYFLSSRTFPIKLPTEITCLPQDFIRIFEDSPKLDQTICLKIIAVKHEGEDGEDSISYYALTKIDGTSPTPVNISLPTDTDTLQLSIVINKCLRSYEYHDIPIVPLYNWQTQLQSFCTPLLQVEWVPLKFLYNQDTFALKIKEKLMPISPIFFKFPVYDTPAVRTAFELKVRTKHVCDIIPCTDFIICPSTLKEPNNDLHGHCHDKQCVLFFEKVYQSWNFW